MWPAEHRRGIAPRRRVVAVAAATVAAVLAAGLAAGCGGRGRAGRGPGSSGVPPSGKADSEVPPRAATGGDGLLGLLPAGADVVVELDMARLRDNPVVGALVRRAAEAPAALEQLGGPAVVGVLGL